MRLFVFSGLSPSHTFSCEFDTLPWPSGPRLAPPYVPSAGHGEEMRCLIWMHIRTIETGGAQAATVVLCTECVHHAYLMFMGDSSFRATFDCLKS